MVHRTLAESVVSQPSSAGPAKIATPEVIKASCLKFLNGQTPKADEKQELLRAQSDKFDYRLVQLQNGIRILLVSDPSYTELASQENGSNGTSDAESSSDHEASDAESEASSCSSASSSSSKKGNDKLAAFAVAVNIGSFKDPWEFQGMAHMLEHMISMGSEAFPSENAIDDFLSSRGGYQNAHTECEYTMYEVKVHRRYLKQAINLLGNAFVAPLLRKESIDREIKPVDTEFVSACTSDDIRANLLLSHFANPEHPLHKFSWGNRKSLITDPTERGLDLHKGLIDFFNAYYKPENIVVAVQSQEPLDNLEQWTTSVFSQVKRESKASTPTEEGVKSLSPFDINHRFNRFCTMESINSGTRLHVNWCLPPVLDKYLSSPFDYLSTLIGHEGKGSLIAELRKRDLAIDLVTDSECFCFKNNSILSMFGIDIYLTDSGAERLDEVVQLIFEYISVIRKTGAQEYFFRENQTVSFKSFNNKSEKSPLSNVTHLAKNLLYFPVEHSLIGNRVYYYFDKGSIDDLLAHFLPHNANFIHIGGKFKPELTTLEEPWMRTKYQEMPVPSAWLERANQCTGDYEYFHYPKPNSFIATDFSLLRDTLPATAAERQTGEYPVQLSKTERLSVWYKADFKFNLPRASISLHLLNPCLFDSLRNVVLSDVFFEYLMHQLKEDTYDAHAAELNWELCESFNGVSFRVLGFNHKLPDLLVLILSRLKSIQFDKTILNSMKNEVARLYNNDYQEPENFNLHLRYSILMERYYTLLERWTLIESIDEQGLLEFKNRLLSNMSVELLVQGNMSTVQTMELAKRVDDLLDLSQGQTGVPYVKQKMRIVQLPFGVNKIRALTLTQKNSISLVVCYYQLKPFTFESECYLALFIDIINELCFNTLRTKEGLGYSVGCCENNSFGILGFNVYVNADAEKFQCSFVEERIAEFVDKTCREYVQQQLTADKFSEFVSSAIKRKQAPDVSLEHEVKRNIGEINAFDYCFDRLKRQTAQLKQATLDGLKKWAMEFIFLPAEQRKQLTIQVVGNGSKSLEECVTLDQLPVTESMIPRESSHTKCKTLQLLQSKDDREKCFINNVEAFKQRLEMYPPMPPTKDLV